MKATRLSVSALFVAVSLALATSASANEVPPAPDLAEESQYQSNVISVTFDAPLPVVRAFMDARPITEFLEPSGNIPQITGIEVLQGPWGSIPSLRRVDLDGGYHVHERVLTNDADELTYQIWDITAPSGRFIDHIYGELRLTEIGGQTQMTWSYNIKPSIFFARPFIRSYLDDDFRPFMENGLTGFAAAFTQAQAS
ncbi:SRPBCC family protein [Yoonia litorea]|uniref:Polyketide cyclase / dehydrase and lipid transport n=1 Tax=Yoonia litorea TaxID=1123755 RepID=A0A1I6N224_9RHOB|nr:SRPBCC family protein [Yoonia litorea]SFS21999.1 Polyketide cyclase / dehydrase and lipid transport [Yoonia litorea]